MDKYIKAKELEKLLVCKPDMLRKMVKEGAPGSDRRNGYPLKEFLQWVTRRNNKSKGFAAIKERATSLLINDGSEPPLIKADHKQAKGLTGLMPALERARTAELAAYENHLAIQKQTGVISTSALDAWQKTLDILRKCEKDFTDVLKSRRELIEIKKVQEWLEQRNEQSKTILLNLPAKLAPSLENLPWHEIQKRLTQEIRDVVCKFTEFK
jgi:hypothetical protein